MITGKFLYVWELSTVFHILKIIHFDLLLLIFFELTDEEKIFWVLKKFQKSLLIITWLKLINCITTSHFSGGGIF